MSNENTFKLLSKINSPADLRKLSIDELPVLCNELRKDIIQEVAVNPGHLASSLGAIEITVVIMFSTHQKTELYGMWGIKHTGTRY